MAFHFIAIASGFKKGYRIAWHYSSEKKLDNDRISGFMKRAKENSLAQFGVHKLTTKSTSWESVIEKDSFFEDVLVTEDEDKFLDLLLEDQEISAVDIANLMIGIMSMSHLKLQKLLYLVYADYLITYRKNCLLNRYKHINMVP